MVKMLNKIIERMKFLKESRIKKTTSEECLDVAGVDYEGEIFEKASTKRALQRAGIRGINLDTVIDVGASDGRWSQDCMQYFPNANYFLIDANSLHTESLQKFCDEHKNAKYAIAAAGIEDGECFFDDTDLFGGVASAVPFGKANSETSMVSIDSVVQKNNLSAPYLIKLDTHGFEVSILKGAKKTLEKAELVIIEAYIFKLDTSESVTFDELCRIMDSYGFRVGDFSEPMWRKKDLMLWQWDLFFFRKENPIFSDNNYA